MSQTKWGREFAGLFCQDIVENISAYYDKEGLSPELRARIEEHVSKCGDCGLVYDTFSKTIELYQVQAEAKMPEDIKQRLHCALRLKDSDPEAS